MNEMTVEELKRALEEEINRLENYNEAVHRNVYASEEDKNEAERLRKIYEGIVYFRREYR